MTTTGHGRTTGGNPCVVFAVRHSSINCTCSDVQCNPNGGKSFDEPRSSPILISTQDGSFSLTSSAEGVHFDLNGDGERELTAWTAAGSDEAFLVLDRNLNGQIDDSMELFGDMTPQLPSDEPNGFLALSIWDDTLNGGNEDGVIDADDGIFNSLQLWIDDNHNGVSEREEVFFLQDLEITYIDLDYKRSRRQDRYGNIYRFQSLVGKNNGKVVAWDVFFVSETSP